ncbi:unnamed protein product [Rhizophagus irregularis]|nr:unnamed protein product [Rhizophagus irregularis]
MDITPTRIVTGNLIKTKIQEKRYGEAVVDEMNALLIAKSKNEIDLLFDKIQTAEENTSDWISFYRQKWIQTAEENTSDWISFYWQKWVI